MPTVTIFVAALFALSSALALVFVVLWLRTLSAYEDRSKAFERAAADCVRLEGALHLFADVDAWSMNEDDRERFEFDAGPWYFDPETDDGNETPWDLARAALSPAEAEDEQHAHAEHLREAREVEQHQEEKHGE